MIPNTGNSTARPKAATTRTTAELVSSLTPARRVRAHSTTSEATWSANGTSAYDRYDDQPNSSVVTQNWTTVGTIGWPCCDRNSCSTRSPRPRSRYISTYQSSAVNQRCEPRHTQYTV